MILWTRKGGRWKRRSKSFPFSLFWGVVPKTRRCRTIHFGSDYKLYLRLELLCVITLVNLTSSFLNPNYFNTSVNAYSRVESYVSGYLSHCSVRARTVGDTTHPSPVRGQTVQLFQRLERVIDIVLPLYGAMTKYAQRLERVIDVVWPLYGTMTNCVVITKSSQLLVVL